VPIKDGPIIRVTIAAEQVEDCSAFLAWIDAANAWPELRLHSSGSIDTLVNFHNWIWHLFSILNYVHPNYSIVDALNLPE
jgi:hypothetical protein